MGSVRQGVVRACDSLATLVDELTADVRVSVRSLRRSLGFTLGVVLTLSICIGANATVFTVLNAAVLRPLPYTDPERIVYLPLLSTDRLSTLQSTTRALSSLAVYRPIEFTLTRRAASVRLSGAEVSPGFFDVLRSPPALGRSLLPGDARVVVVSHGTWMQYLGGDADAIGAPVTLNGERYEVVGVMPSDFAFPRLDTEFWTTLRPSPADGRTRRSMPGIGRLEDGASADQARAEARVIADAPGLPDNHFGDLVTLKERMTAPVRPALLVLQAAALLLLLLACVNVANLLLSRALARRREFAVALAVGAGRLRLARRILTESVMLAALGAVLGQSLSLLCAPVVRPLVRSGIPYLDDIRLDPVIFGVTLVASLVSGLLAGLVPCLALSRQDISRGLRAGDSAGSPDRRVMRIHTLLATAQLALALVLVVSAGLLMTSFWKLVTVDPGFRVDGVLTFEVALPADRYQSMERKRAFAREFLGRIDDLPGIRSAGITNVLPFLFAGFAEPFVLGGVRHGLGEIASERLMLPSYKVVSPGYFRSLGIPLVAGRGFTDRDGESGPPVAVLSETFVRRFSEGNPVGQRMEFLRRSWEVVGVAKDVRHAGLDQEPWPEVYVSYSQVPQERASWLSSMSFAIQGDADLPALVPTIRRMLFRIDETLVLDKAAPLEELLYASVARPRLYGGVVGGFALAALLLAAAGVGSVQAYWVTRRTREIGIRMAVGAGRRDVLGTVLTHGLRLTVAGTALGVVGAVATVRSLEGLLFGVSPMDTAILTGAVVVLDGTAFLACCFPAWRATTIDPVTTLRHD